MGPVAKCPQFRPTKGKGQVKFRVSPVGPFVTHAVTNHVASHNAGNIFPSADLKEKEGQNDCMLKAFTAALHGLPLGPAYTATMQFVRNELQQELEILSVSGRRLNGEESNYGSHAKGYKVGDVVAAAKLLNDRVLRQHKLYLEIDARHCRYLQYKALMKLSSGQRKGRCFLLFGGALSTDKRDILRKQVDNCNKTCHTRKVLGTGDVVSKKFFNTSKYALHAICVKYSPEGYGVIDDPGKKCYHAVNMRNLCDSLGYISDVLECKLMPT
jgi:hypothetical protein